MSLSHSFSTVHILNLFSSAGGLSKPALIPNEQQLLLAQLPKTISVNDLTPISSGVAVSSGHYVVQKVFSGFKQWTQFVFSKS